ncbi:HAD family hydrolase [Nisaea acidiphila]|uniref:HAD family hydrolase n=1 Tax=Nisaea acidiphila TaxID=1862145 RepID=A0A9J7B0I6_9PROT|nr:HAD family hydrolase [Nisaea acidiphila]UUX51197.1 HAD family hydrolase [Nisaea acidiphila]
MAQSIRGVAFDKDGTLIDFEKTWLPGLMSAARDLVGLHGIDADPDALTRAAGGDPEDNSIAPGTLLAQGTALEVATLWHGLAPGLPDPVPMAEWLDDYWLNYAAGNLTPVCDLGALFSDLRDRDIRIAVVTNDAERGARDMIARMGLSELVDFVAGYDSGHTPKPAPDMIRAFLAAHALTPREAIMVGDNAADMQAGRAAGCFATIGVLTGATPEGELSKIADFVLPDAGHLPDLIARAL